MHNELRYGVYKKFYETSLPHSFLVQYHSPSFYQNYEDAKYKLLSYKNIGIKYGVGIKINDAELLDLNSLCDLLVEYEYKHYLRLKESGSISEMHDKNSIINHMIYSLDYLLNSGLIKTDSCFEKVITQEIYLAKYILQLEEFFVISHNVKFYPLMHVYQ